MNTIDPAAEAAIAAEVRAASAEWSEAVKRRDAEAAARFLAPEYALYAPNIGVMPRERWLAALKDYVVHSYEFSDVVVQVYGDVGVMRSKYQQQATVFGQDRSGAMLVTDVWVKKDGRWQVVARHTSWLEQSPATAPAR